MISLCTGKKLMVRESVVEVIEAAREHRRSTGTRPADVVTVAQTVDDHCRTQGG